ncbi:MAG TPA: ATP-binding protein [Phycisphaerales bacterium]|nr:ATP-binding protein [Phycisphaerales bacterium]
MPRTPASPSTPPPQRGTLAVVNDPRAMDEAQNRVVHFLEQQSYPKASVFALRLAMHEALMNAFKHGHKGLPPTTPVYLTYEVTHDHVDLDVEDQGPGFTPEDVPDPTLEENLERGSGRGLLLIRAYMSRVEYNKQGNKLSMTYARPKGA